jgi:hypothetical protein
VTCLGSCSRIWFFSVLFSVTAGPLTLVTQLSPQILLNCVTNNSHGCRGGDPTSAYDYILHNAIHDETCTNYVAEAQVRL